MLFIALLIALLLLQWPAVMQTIHRDQIFHQISSKCKNLAGEMAGAWLSLLLVAVSLSILLECFDDGFWGLLGLVLNALLLAYAFGRGDYQAKLSAYFQAWRQGDYKQLAIILESIAHAKPVDQITSPEDPEDAYVLHQRARQIMVYAIFQRLFVVVFWFMLFGPVAAVIYRLLQIMHEQSPLRGFLAKVPFYMEWLAARFTAATFAIVGDFSKGINHLLGVFWRVEEPIDRLLLQSSIAALHLRQDWLTLTAQSPEDTVLFSKASEELSALNTLLKRSLITMVVLIAIVELIL